MRISNIFDKNKFHNQDIIDTAVFLTPSSTVKLSFDCQAPAFFVYFDVQAHAL